MWNIQGLNSSTFGLKSLALDVIILQDTWCKADTVTHCPTGYREVIVSSQKHSSVNRGRDSGGLIIWYKSELQNLIDPLKIGKYHIWLKLKK
jgi:exonuclease III